MNKSRSIGTRLLFILLSLVFLIGPGGFFFYVAYLALREEGLTGIIIPAVMGSIFIGGGIAGVISNIVGMKIKHTKVAPKITSIPSKTENFTADRKSFS